MDDENGDDETEETEVSEEEFGDIVNSAMMNVQSMFGMRPMSASAEMEYSDTTEAAILCIKASDALNRVAEYIEKSDLPLGDDMTPKDIQEMNAEEQMFIYAHAALGSGINRYATVVQGDDDDDDNPFKVSDGDDPIY